jgi:hypothetical protein
VSRREALIALAATTALAAGATTGAGADKEEPKGKHDVKRFEERMDVLTAGLAKLGDVKDLKELIILIRKPGWTTPAEFMLVSSVVESMIAQAGLKQVLVKGSRAVSAG